MFGLFVHVCPCLPRFKETKYQENTEKLLIYNDSGLEVEVQFQFQQDTSASTYLVDPSIMILKPEEKQVSPPCIIMLAFQSDFVPIGTFEHRLLLPGGDCVGLPHQGRLDERQPPLLDQGESRDYYDRLLLLGCSARTEDGHQTLSF